jgi:hypothetical protein
MAKVAYLSCFFNPCDFKLPKQNCLKFLNETVPQFGPDFYFGQVSLNKNKSAILPHHTFSFVTNYLELNSDSAIWHKERALNRLIEQFDLLNRYEYLVWLDCDVLMAYKTKFTFECGGNDNYFQAFVSCGRQEKNKSVSYNVGIAFQLGQLDTKKEDDGDMGLGWGIKTSFLKDHCGGNLFDFGIVGGGDTFMFNAILGRKFNTGCVDLDLLINKYCDKPLDKPGYLWNSLVHLYHGEFKNRQYDSRIEILRKHNFNPSKHLNTNIDSLYELVNCGLMKCDIEGYLMNRKEDD